MKQAIGAAVLTGVLFAVAIGSLGVSNDGAGGGRMWSQACGGDRALQADPSAFSRCMRAVPPWVD